jgi:hypothetical protein
MRPDANDTICPIFTSSAPAGTPSASTAASRLGTCAWWSAPHVDHTVVATDHELVAVVGDVATEIRDVAVRLDQHAALARVAEVFGAQPSRTFAVEYQPLARSTSIVSRPRPSSIDAWLYHSS